MGETMPNATLDDNGQKDTLDDLAMDRLEAVMLRLPEDHKFNVILYGHAADAWKVQPVNASIDQKLSAVRFARRYQPWGATKTSAALEKAYTMECMDRMYFLSDAKPTLGLSCTEILHRINTTWTSNNPTKVPINSIAFGNLSSTYYSYMSTVSDSLMSREVQGEGEVVAEDVEMANQVGFKVEITFEPRTIGMTTSAGVVTAVAEKGQAQEHGVEVGWTIVRIDGELYTGEAQIDEKVEGTDMFDISFATDTSPDYLHPPSFNSSRRFCVDDFMQKVANATDGQFIWEHQS